MKSKMKHSNLYGFTLIELLVVIAIIGLLSSVVLVALIQARAKSRNAERRANLIQVTKAIELYYSQNGSYPTTNDQWWGQTSTYPGGQALTGANSVVPNLAPQFIGSLPKDVNTGKANPSLSVDCLDWRAGYTYRSDGKDYKFAVNCLHEGAIDSSLGMLDPVRPTRTLATYTPGAANW